ncbi:hypothetical protein GGS24DRAFT_517795 [Hypoxylon argillaceum]|nr:hypothetical protein GGS24DRAFT_517795 [Hypoxylon argillaceum]
MDNDTVFQTGLQALEAQGRSAPPRPGELTESQKVINSLISQLDSAIAQRRTTKERKRTEILAQVENDNTTASSSEPPPHAHPPEEPAATTSTAEPLPSRLQREREEIARLVIDDLLPRVERVAAEAAEREIDRLIEAADGETAREKMQAILGRVSSLSDGELETLFLRSAVMASVLRRVLRRAEMEEEAAGWEDLAPGYSLE